MIRFQSIRRALGAAAVLAAPLCSHATVAIVPGLVANGDFESFSGNALPEGTACQVGSDGADGCGTTTLVGWSGIYLIVSNTDAALGASADPYADPFSSQANRFELGLQGGQFAQAGFGAVGSSSPLTLVWSDTASAGVGGASYDVVLNGVTVAANIAPTGGNWHLRSATVTMPQGGFQSLSFVAHAAAAQATTFIDNVYITSNVPEPATAAMLVGGLAFVAARRRGDAGLR